MKEPKSVEVNKVEKWKVEDILNKRIVQDITFQYSYICSNL